MNGLKVPIVPRNLGKKLKLPQNPPKSSFKRGEFGLHTENQKKKKNDIFSAVEFFPIFVLVKFLIFDYFFP